MRQLHLIQQVLDQIRAKGAQVYGVSIDSPFVQAAFAKELGLDFLLLGDPNREAAHRFAVLLPELAGIRQVTTRAVFVFAPGRGLIYQWLKGDAELPPIDRLLAALAGI